MRTSEYSLHDVEVIRIEQNKARDSMWIALTVKHRDGVESELCFWPVRDGNISIEIGEKE